MAPKPLTDEAIALTEKKMDMALDDIIKMSKTNTMKPKKQRNRAQKFAPNAVRERYTKARSFMDTRSSLRQGSLARRRSNFQGNQFSSSAEVARKAATAPIRNRGFNHSRTFNVNKPRAGLSAAQKVVTYGGGFTVTKPVQQANNILPKQKPQTLDSRFASMKEQRMQVVCHNRATEPEEMEVFISLDRHGQETVATDTTCNSSTVCSKVCTFLVFESLSYSTTSVS